MTSCRESSSRFDSNASMHITTPISYIVSFVCIDVNRLLVPCILRDFRLPRQSAPKSRTRSRKIINITPESKIYHNTVERAPSDGVCCLTRSCRLLFLTCTRLYTKNRPESSGDYACNSCGNVDPGGIQWSHRPISFTRNVASPRPIYHAAC